MSVYVVTESQSLAKNWEHYFCENHFDFIWAQALEFTPQAGDFVLFLWPNTQSQALQVFDFKAKFSSIPMGVLSFHPQVSEAIHFKNAGFIEYWAAPLDPLEILICIRKECALPQKHIADTNSKLKNATSWEPLNCLPISPMAKVQAMLELLAPKESSVFLHGESGSGKEVVAQLIHKHSKVFGGPFVAINCGALSAQLLESELFGHVKGAFTGAHEDALGKIRLSDGGTLFLDEIAELPLSGQTRLLRVLQERKVCPIGGKAEIAVNFRLIVATHKNLLQMVHEGLFRQDLYYRICVFLVQIPPLRSRLCDMPLLAPFLWKKLNQSQSLNATQIEELCSHSWPGNIRELGNVLERFTVMAELGQTLKSCIGFESETAISLNPTLQDQIQNSEKQEIIQALKLCKGNKSKAAQHLNLTRSALLRRIEKFGIV